MESGGPLEKEVVMAKIEEYEKFVNLTLQPKIKHLESVKVTVTATINADTTYRL